MTPILLDLIYGIIFIVGIPFAIYKTVTSARFRAGWWERFGGVADLPSGPRIWVHCASVGEALLARTLVDRLKSEYPEAEIVFSTNTNTGKETAQRTFPGHTAFYFPLDLSPVVSRTLKRIKPSVIILIELELWPNFLSIARRRGVPVVVVNGRITERSGRRYRWLSSFARRMFRNVQCFAVQNEEYAERLKGLGVAAGGVIVSGTMKYDTVATEAAADVVEEYRRRLRIGPEDTVLVGGCTHAGEDELLIEYVKARPNARLRLVLAPRHRERAPAVERLIREAGLLPVRKTEVDAGTAPADFEHRPHVILVDTTGELARLYAVATVVFVGGSFVRHGGHNMIEPAALGKAVVFGPNTWNFREPVEMLLRSCAAVRVDEPGLLAHVLDGLTTNSSRRAELGQRARALIEQCKGATGRNLAAIKPVLDDALRPREQCRE